MSAGIFFFCYGFLWVSRESFRNCWNIVALEAQIRKLLPRQEDNHFRFFLIFVKGILPTFPDDDNDDVGFVICLRRCVCVNCRVNRIGDAWGRFRNLVPALIGIIFLYCPYYYYYFENCRRGKKGLKITNWQENVEKFVFFFNFY